MICTHHILTSICCWTRYICTYEEYSSFLSASSFDGKGFLVSINVTTRSNPPSPWFPYSGIVSPWVEAALTLPAISSQFSFQILKPITTYENEFIFSDLTAFYLTISFENICTLKRGTSSRIQIIVTFI